MSGSLAASCAVLLTNMPETVKTRIQLDGEVTKDGVTIPKQYKSLSDAYIKILKIDGIRGLQAGLGSAIGVQLVMNGLRLGLFGPIQSLIKNATNCNQNNFILKVVSGAISGAIGVTVSSPLYLAKNRLQSQSRYFQAAERYTYKNTFDCLSQVYRQEGFFGLFRGVSGALPRVIFGSATQLSIYDTIKSVAIDKFHCADGIQAHFVASFISSLFTVTVMNPFDVISTRMYQSSGQQTVYNNVIDCFRKTIQGEGLSALQKGWLALYIRLGPHTVLTFIFLEKIRYHFLTIDAFSTDVYTSDGF
ncbi:unnamed protein product [Didymodactylos carnosus]|uniref:Mitochondrial carrier protein n=1 Tax=Didymodactylos carnosus TaxID=1234261 RepID=A0A814G5J4_9BILA|nr:unnamed protein product [Didymodactylos carnosus]CAF3766147.1 unnamed protein product [Didymodactylos carnosus]